MTRRWRAACAVGPALMLVAACASRPPAPAWALRVHDGLDRYRQAYLSGSDRVADAQFAQARAALASTGQATQVARAQLVRCAVQAASLVFAPCDGFEPLRPDVAAPERAYARYLAGQDLAAHEVALLPAAQREALRNDLADRALARIDDPLSRLVAAAVKLRAGRATPETLQVAVDAAASQGWRRPLLAWLGAQVMRAERSGDMQEVQRLRRRIALVMESG